MRAQLAAVVVVVALAVAAASCGGTHKPEARKTVGAVCDVAREVCARIIEDDPAVARGICTLTVTVCDLVTDPKEEEEAMPSPSNPRTVVIPGLRSPHTQRPGTSANSGELAAQKIGIVRPVVGIRLAADSQVDVVDLWPDGEIGEPVNLRNRIRVSAESPWYGRLDKGELIVTPVRAFDSTSTAIYADATPATHHPLLKLELFECHCGGEGDCDGHAPPLPTKLAPVVLIEGALASTEPAFSYRIPTCGREIVTVSFALGSYALGAVVDYEIKGVDYAQERATGTIEDIEEVLDSALGAAAGEYAFQYVGAAFDELRVTFNNTGRFNHFVKLEAK